MIWLIWLVLMLVIAFIPGIHLFYEQYKLARMVDTGEGNVETEAVIDYS